VGKKRLDTLVLERHLAADIETARALIGSGRVDVDGHIADKAGSQYAQECRIRLRERQRYASRGGDKLAAGLTAFRVDPAGMVCADIGCSTGGFTDCLLQHGAKRVYSVDVGYGVLDWQLRKDSRVVVLERTNARYLTREQIPEPVDLAVIDASFISLDLLLKSVSRLFAGRVCIIALVKPQFELPRGKVARGGVVREDALHQQALEQVRGYASAAGLICRGIGTSPLKGAKGNTEFLMHLVSAKDQSKTT
jgi:23S rRNA (cytidine1920-2'-O)/16S rRNA (cytidine1409-2'-O)-methyltransferase